MLSLRLYFGKVVVSLGPAMVEEHGEILVLHPKHLQSVQSVVIRNKVPLSTHQQRVVVRVISSQTGHISLRKEDTPVIIKKTSIKALKHPLTILSQSTSPSEFAALGSQINEAVVGNSVNKITIFPRISRSTTIFLTWISDCVEVPNDKPISRKSSSKIPNFFECLFPLMLSRASIDNSKGLGLFISFSYFRMDELIIDLYGPKPNISSVSQNSYTSTKPSCLG
ncbi:hypothetical protein PIB30_088583 [Stylosanthes scabra]|uniref:Uncharacterized protein n=1 Tax=Stylosanthes scabra TaxID=79078 RepID=A0ABU6RV35_9FABA|nr:hypothetical protein [Stylosanthes scabra]